ncbi:MAG: hypothetical protein WCG95_08125 [bacterium]
MEKNKADLLNQISELPDLTKYLKIGGIVVGSLLGIYLLGHVFKIGAHTVRSFNELKKSLHGY